MGLYALSVNPRDLIPCLDPQLAPGNFPRESPGVQAYPAAGADLVYRPVGAQQPGHNLQETIRAARTDLVSPQRRARVRGA